jgi:hypothetical protein
LIPIVFAPRHPLFSFLPSIVIRESQPTLSQLFSQIAKPLEEFNLIVRMQCNDGLLPPRKLAHTHPKAFLFAVPVLGSYSFDTDVEQFFDCRLDLVLGGNRAHLERIGVVPSALVRPFLGHEWAEDDLVRAQIDAGRAMDAWLPSSQLPHVGLRVWS